MDAASGAGNVDLSTSVILVSLKRMSWVKLYAVLRPNTPEPNMSIEEGIWEEDMIGNDQTDSRNECVVRK